VSNLTYEACFRYTLVARISPLWNQVDSYLIQGRDFLLSTSFLNAIKFEVVNRGELLIILIIAELILDYTGLRRFCGNDNNR
jgi:hypothetical protein